MHSKTLAALAATLLLLSSCQGSKKKRIAVVPKGTSHVFWITVHAGAAAAGEKFDASLGALAKLRSRHNTFLAVPVVFLMLSNHFPVATYGNRYAWQVLVMLVLAGWVAARVIREF